MSYFDVLEKDVEFVIMFVNYLLEKSEESPQQANVPTNTTTPQRVRVNDDTATGGWW